ncbi:MAG: hypothetical protein GX242_03660 [Clostridiales bacterium]|nr:hypothetical protein [Clostridiales bacterium]
MKILFFGLSSKFIHTMPSGWFLAEFLQQKGIEIVEKYHSVNEDYDTLRNEILCKEWDAVLFSVYIFNVKTVRQLKI